MHPSKGKGLILLRFSKELTRRLSNLTNVVFCGRILVLLASVFSLSELSGVNLKGEFNSSNQTVWEDPIENRDVNAIDIDGEKETKKEDGLFRDVWSIQAFLSRPTLLFEPTNFAAFKTHFDKIKAAFHLLNQHQLPQSTPTSTQTPSQFFPKYLTSRNLFPLQLSDPAFRSQLTLQLLLILNYLHTLSPTIRSTDYARVKKFDGVKENRNLGGGQCVDSQWVQEQCIELQEMLGVEKCAFRDTAVQVLANERNWMRSCQAFDLPPHIFPTADTCTSVPITPPQSVKGLGNADMTRLWKQGRLLDRTLTTATIPINASLKAYLAPLDDQLLETGERDPDVDEEYLLSSDGLYNWRAFRIAGREGEVSGEGVCSKGLVMRMREREGRGMAATKGEHEVDVVKGGVVDMSRSVTPECVCEEEEEVVEDGEVLGDKRMCVSGGFEVEDAKFVKIHTEGTE